MKIYKTNLILIIIILTFFYSCQTKSNESYQSRLKKDAFYTIDFANLVRDKRDISISEIAQSVDYLHLDNKQLIGNVLDIKVTSDYIFIYHTGSELLTQFDRNGKFIRYIGNYGRGPKEYQMIRMFSIDEMERLVYIHSNFNPKVLVYDLEGNYQRTIKFEGIDRGRITWSRDSFLISFKEPIIGNEQDVFIENNFIGDTIQKIRNFINWNNEGKGSSVISYWGRNEYYWLNNKLHMKGWYNDTVYTYNTKNKIIPKYFVKLNEYKIPEELIPEKRPKKHLPKECYWIGLNESRNYVFVRYGSHGLREIGENEYGCILFNKRTMQGFALNNDGELYGFINDLDGGPDFQPRYSNDSLAFMEISAMEMKEFLNSEKFINRKVKYAEEKEKLKFLGKNLDENDNQFLIIAKLKN